MIRASLSLPIFLLSTTLSAWLIGCGGTVTDAQTSGDTAAGGQGGAGAGGVGGAGGSGGQGGSGASTGGGTAAPLVWGPCPKYFQQECATAALPLRPEQPDGETISVLVARRLANVPDAPQLWLLEGGPGGSGGDFYEFIDQLVKTLPGVDIYTLDHRGVGESTRLACAGEFSPNGLTTSVWQKCAQDLKAKWGDDLGAFNTTNAAHDVAKLIDLTRAPKQQVFVYGVSYGTFWSERYLELYPEQATGVILDSIVSPGGQYLSDYDPQFDVVAKDYLELCKADALCASKLGPDPWARIEALFAKVDTGHCSQIGFDRPLLRQVLGSLLLRWTRRVYGLALAYRLDRCDAGDVSAIFSMFDTFYGQAQDGRGNSPALSVNIMFSELWESPPPSQAELQAEDDAALFSLDLESYYGPVFDFWPKYDAGAFPLAWPETKIPILMLNGTLDPQTPYEKAKLAEPHFAKPHQTFVTLPNGPHGVMFQSPTGDPEGIQCGQRIVASFVNSPESPPDTSCIADVLPVSFTGDENTLLVLGTEDLWENSKSANADKPDAKVVPAKASMDWKMVKQALQKRPLSWR